jgi:hypothetical protein
MQEEEGEEDDMADEVCLRRSTSQCLSSSLFLLTTP